MTRTKIKGQTKHGIVHTDGSATAPNGKYYTREQMQGFVKEYRGVNRIHKPLFILFYTDVMNGNHDLYS